MDFDFSRLEAVFDNFHLVGSHDDGDDRALNGVADWKQFLVAGKFDFEAGFDIWEGAALEDLAELSSGAGAMEFQWPVIAVFLVGA